ncbi:hypothetical protein BJY52DRAFT_1194835 [Lactarius psammicola]|nr:hypothetical protein BJY52DRAFT_1194835 [Lactarius psammicola]
MENQWVNKEDIFAEQAIKEFENSKSAPRKDKRRRHNKLSSSANPTATPLSHSSHAMSSPSNSYYEPAVIITDEQSNQPIAALPLPTRSWLPSWSNSPNSKEEQCYVQPNALSSSSSDTQSAIIRRTSFSSPSSGESSSIHSRVMRVCDKQWKKISSPSNIILSTPQLEKSVAAEHSLEQKSWDFAKLSWMVNLFERQYSEYQSLIKDQQRWKKMAQVWKEEQIWYAGEKHRAKLEEQWQLIQRIQDQQMMKVEMRNSTPFATTSSSTPKPKKVCKKPRIYSIQTGAQCIKEMSSLMDMYSPYP